VRLVGTVLTRGDVSVRPWFGPFVSTSLVVHPPVAIPPRFALDTYPFLSLVDASVGGVGDVGLPDDGSGDGLSEVERRKVLRFHSQADGDEDSTGFFIAKFIKTGSMLG